MRLVLAFVAAVSAARPPAGLSHAALGRSLFLNQRHSGEKPAVFSPSSHNKAVRVAGFCLTSDASPACDAPPCCCWSTFAKPRHAAYPNAGQGDDERRCLNPPAEYIYVPDPGFTHTNGQYESLRDDNVARLEGRNLCCLIPATSPEYFSSRPPEFGTKEHFEKMTSMTKEAPEVAPVPTLPPVMPSGTDAVQAAAVVAAAPTVPLAPAAPVVPAAVADPAAATFGVAAPAAAPVAAPAASPFSLDTQDVETMEMEEAALKYSGAASQLSSAAGAMQDSLNTLDVVRQNRENNPDVAKRKQHIETMKSAIREWAAKRRRNLDKLNKGEVDMES